MGTIESQITSLTIVYSTVYSGADQRKYQSSASLAFVRGFPAQRASNAENVFIWWRHHGPEYHSEMVQCKNMLQLKVALLTVCIILLSKNKRTPCIRAFIHFSIFHGPMSQLLSQITDIAVPQSQPSQPTKFMGPTYSPSGSCRLQMGPMSAPWTLLSGITSFSVGPRPSVPPPRFSRCSTKSPQSLRPRMT